MTVPISGYNYELQRDEFVRLENDKILSLILMIRQLDYTVISYHMSYTNTSDYKETYLGLFPSLTAAQECYDKAFDQAIRDGWEVKRVLTISEHNRKHKLDMEYKQVAQERMRLRRLEQNIEEGIRRIDFEL